MRKQELLIFIGVIILVIVIFFAYLIASFFSPSGNSQIPASPSPSIRSFHPVPFPENSSLPETLPASANPSGGTPVSPGGLSKEDLLNMLPVKTNQFNIEYYYDGDIFKVTIKENPYEDNKTQVENWFRNLGFDQKNLNIYWDAFPEVKR